MMSKYVCVAFTGAESMQRERIAKARTAPERKVAPSLERNPCQLRSHGSRRRAVVKPAAEAAYSELNHASAIVR